MGCSVWVEAGQNDGGDKDDGKELRPRRGNGARARVSKGEKGGSVEELTAIRRACSAARGRCWCGRTAAGDLGRPRLKTRLVKPLWGFRRCVAR